jgi:hypothetical protein
VEAKQHSGVGVEQKHLATFVEEAVKRQGAGARRSQSLFDVTGSEIVTDCGEQRHPQGQCAAEMHKHAKRIKFFGERIALTTYMGLLRSRLSSLA